MSDQTPYTPTPADMALIYVQTCLAKVDCSPGRIEREFEDAASEEWDRFIAQVRRDAAREALDGYAETLDALTAPFRHLEADRVRHYRDTHYPEDVAP